MTVPRIFATQPAGNVPASYLDEDFAYVLNSNPLMRLKLTSDLNIYVRTDGSDSNTGFADNAAGALATWQAAVNVARTYDLNNHDIFIRAGEEGAPKTWTLTTEVLIYSFVGFGIVHLMPSTSGTTINAASGHPVFILTDTLQAISCGGITMNGSGAFGYGLIEVAGKSTWQHETGADGPNYGTTNGAHVWVHDTQANVLMDNSTYRISGGGPYHVVAANGGHAFMEGGECIITTPVSIGVFVLAVTCGTIQATGTTYTNKADVTGGRYSVQKNSVVDTLGNGENYFPGTTAGSYDLLGVYADTFNTTPYSFNTGLTIGGISGVVIADPVFYLSKSPGAHTNYFLGTVDGVHRWLVVPGNSNAESGSNAGSDFDLVACADDGSTIGTVWRATRATRQLTIDGCFGTSVPTAMTNATYTLLDTDNYLIANRAGTVTITLPSALAYQGRVFTVKTIQAQTVVSNASDVVPLIGGAAGTAILAGTAGKWATLVSNGTTWDIMAGN